MTNQTAISFKQILMSKLRVGLPTTLEHFTNQSLAVSAHKLSETIIFHDVNIDTDSHSDATTDGYVTDYTHLPYTDMLLTTSLDYFFGSPMCVALRIWVQYDQTYLAYYLSSSPESEAAKRNLYALFGLAKLNPEKTSFAVLEIADMGIPKDNKTRQRLEDEINTYLSRALYMLTHYKTEIKSDPTCTHSITSKVNASKRPLYIEYTLDLSKPITERTVAKGGTHASPMEHTRRGHWRTSKLGKRYFVRDTVVNKGSERGKVVKDYTM